MLSRDSEFVITFRSTTLSFDVLVPEPAISTPSPLPSIVLLKTLVPCESGYSWMPRSELSKITLRTISVSRALQTLIP